MSQRETIMKVASKSVAALAFVLALAACGGGAEDADEAAATDTPAATARRPTSSPPLAHS